MNIKYIETKKDINKKIKLCFKLKVPGYDCGNFLRIAATIVFKIKCIFDKSFITEKEVQLLEDKIVVKSKNLGEFVVNYKEVVEINEIEDVIIISNTVIHITGIISAQIAINRFTLKTKRIIIGAETKVIILLNGLGIRSEQTIPIGIVQERYIILCFLVELIFKRVRKNFIVSGSSINRKITDITDINIVFSVFKNVHRLFIICIII